MARLAAGVAILVATWYLWPRAPRPVDLTCTVDLAEAAVGRLTVSVKITGPLPRTLLLAVPGDGGEARRPPPGLTILGARDVATLDSAEPRPVVLEPEGRGWILKHGPDAGVVVDYSLDLSRTGRLEDDIRRHLTGAVHGGFRAAAYDMFLVPEGVPVGEVAVLFRGGDEKPLAAPWPHRTPESAVYRPDGLRGLTGALLAWGDLRLHERELVGCFLRVASAGEWMFADEDLVAILARITRTEIDFFGSSPSPAILCLLSPNPVAAADGFDFYGIHLGQSVILFLSEETTYADLSEQAATIVAHEMFHGWLGEAIRQEHPDMLWFTEGATTWYTYRTLLVAGVWDLEWAERVAGGRVDQDYLASPLLGVLPLAGAAATVMTDPVVTRFAYAGGTLAAHALDRRLAEACGRPHPLDEVLRLLYTEHRGEALTRELLEAAVLSVTGYECGPWLERFVYGKETLPRPESMF